MAATDRISLNLSREAYERLLADNAWKRLGLSVVAVPAQPAAPPAPAAPSATTRAHTVGPYLQVPAGAPLADIACEAECALAAVTVLAPLIVNSDLQGQDRREAAEGLQRLSALAEALTCAVHAELRDARHRADRDPALGSAETWPKFTAASVAPAHRSPGGVP
jgi:hypothetical protein